MSIFIKDLSLIQVVIPVHSVLKVSTKQTLVCDFCHPWCLKVIVCSFLSQKVGSLWDHLLEVQVMNGCFFQSIYLCLSMCVFNLKPSLSSVVKTSYTHF